MEQKTGFVATLSLIAAVASYFLTFTGHPLWGLLTALVSIPLGIIGIIMAASPRVGGGMLSIFAIVLGVFAAGLAVLGTIGAVIF